MLKCATQMFLAWLLNPSENHGLGSFFLHHFLKQFISENKSLLPKQITLFDLETYNLSDVEIRREWNNIDILLIINEGAKKIVVTIENKVYAPQTGNQLERYKQTIQNEFPNHIQLFIYLTPDNQPSNEESWCRFSYSKISMLVSNILKYRKSILNENVKEFISQYNVILRRYIVGNSEIEQICQQLYKKHSKALDLIFQYKPDVELQISNYLQNKINATPSISFDSAVKSEIRFSTDVFDKKIDKISEGWTKTNRILLFMFSNYDRKLVLNLHIGPGPQQYREKIYQFCQQQPALFKPSNRKFATKWNVVFQKKFLDKKDFEDKTFEELKEKIDKAWSSFIANELITINTEFEKFY